MPYAREEASVCHLQCCGCSHTPHERHAVLKAPAAVMFVIAIYDIIIA
jgi:hypothetical protein